MNSYKLYSKLVQHKIAGKKTDVDGRSNLCRYAPLRPETDDMNQLSHKLAQNQLVELFQHYRTSVEMATHSTEKCWPSVKASEFKTSFFLYCEKDNYSASIALVFQDLFFDVYPLAEQSCWVIKRCTQHKIF